MLKAPFLGASHFLNATIIPKPPQDAEFSVLQGLNIFIIKEMPLLKMQRQPYSVLVVIYKKNKDFLLIQRADDANFWQSVTGGIDEGEKPLDTAYRELLEETGIDARALGITIRDHHKTNQYAIREQWRHRYQDDALINTEHVFSICVPDDITILLDPNEHTDFIWLTQLQAAEKAWSPSNRDEILAL